MTAEEIFNMFFGGAFPSQTVYMRRGGGGGGGGTANYQRQAHFQRQFHTQTQEVRCFDTKCYNTLVTGYTRSSAGQWLCCSYSVAADLADTVLVIILYVLRVGPTLQPSAVTSLFRLI